MLVIRQSCYACPVAVRLGVMEDTRMDTTTIDGQDVGNRKHKGQQLASRLIYSRCQPSPFLRT
jgi:hypothetical protein